MKTLLTILSFLLYVTLGAQTQFGTDFVGGVEHFLGESLAITPDATRLVVPSPGANNNAGLVNIYDESGNGWAQVGNSINGAAGNSLGISVDISDDGKRVVAGGYGGNGLLEIYEESGGSWTQVGATINGGAGEEFGGIVTISGDGKRVAASGFNTTAVRIYEESGGTWSQLGSSINADSYASLSFSSDGKRLVIGANNSVKVYGESGGSWTQIGSDLSSTVTTLGSSVSISADGKRVAAGGGGAQDAIIVFEESGGAWSQVGSAITNAVGSTVAISGDGKSVLNGDRSDSKAALFEESGGIWTQTGMTVSGPANSSFGGGLAINHNGGRFAVGGSVHSVSYSSYEGIARTYNSPLNTSVGDVAEGVAGEMTVFPNPSSGSFQIQLEGLDKAVTQVAVTDALGRVVWETVPGKVGSDWSGDVALSEHGVYLITAKVGAGMFRQLLVVVE